VFSLVACSCLLFEHMACDLCALRSCFCFVCVSACPRLSCYLIISSFSPPVLPYYLPCFLYYLLSLCLQSCASSLSKVSCCVVLFQSSLVFFSLPGLFLFVLFCFIFISNKSPSFLRLHSFTPTWQLVQRSHSLTFPKITCNCYK